MLSNESATLLQTVGTWAAVACALIAVSLQNRTARRLMQLQLSVQISAQYESETMQRIRSQLARRSLLDRIFVGNYFGYDIPYYWAALASHVRDLRLELKDPSMYEELEHMAATLAKAQRSPLRTEMPALDITEQTVKAFLRLELARTGGGDHHAAQRLRVNRRMPQRAG